jgi:hypothetical protein
MCRLEISYSQYQLKAGRPLKESQMHVLSRWGETKPRHSPQHSEERLLHQRRTKIWLTREEGNWQPRR